MFVGQTHNLSTLHTILSTGSPLKPQSFDYVYRDIKEDLLLGSITGQCNQTTLTFRDFCWEILSYFRTFTAEGLFTLAVNPFCKRTDHFHLHNVKQKTGRFNKTAGVNRPLQYSELYPSYHPQRSCGKVMFLHLSVILFTGGCLSGRPLPGQRPPGHRPPRQRPSLDRDPLDRDLPLPAAVR